MIIIETWRNIGMINLEQKVKEFLDNGFSSEKPFYDIKFTV